MISWRWVALLPLVLLVACSSEQETIEKYLSSGKSYYEQGDMGRASVQLRNVLKLDPNQFEASQYLSQIAEQQQNWKAMYRYLKKMEERRPEDVEVKARLAQLLLMLGQVDEVEKLAGEILALAPEDPRVYLFTSSAAYLKGNFELALAQAEKGLALDDSSAEQLTIVAAVYRKQGKLEEALALLAEALEKHPNVNAIRLVRIDFNRDKGDIPAIESDLRALVKTSPNAEEFYLMLATLLRDQAKRQEALSLLKAYHASHPAALKSMMGIVDLTQRLAGIEEANASLNEFIATNSELFPLRFFRVKRLINAEDLEGAASELVWLQAHVQTVEDVISVGVGQVELQYLHGNEEAADAALEAIIAEHGQSEAALILRAQRHLSKNNVEDAVADLRLVLRNNPSSVQALIILGKAYLSNGSLQLADDSFRKVLEFNPGNTSAAVPVVNRLVAEGNTVRSEQILVNALQHDPGNAYLLALMAQIKLSEQDWAGVQQIVNQLDDTQTDQAYRDYISARIFQGQEQYSLAIERYESALKGRPTMQGALEGIAFCYIQQSNTEQLIKRLNTYISEHPDLAGGYLIKAAVLREDGELNVAVTVLQEGIASNPLWAQGYGQLATLYQLSGQPDKEIQVLLTGLEEMPDNNNLAMLAASAYERHEQYDKALALYERSYSLNPSNLIVINNIASLLTDRYPSKENISRAVTLAKVLTGRNQPYFTDTYAWAIFKNGQTYEAEQLLRKVVESSPEVAVFNYHLGLVLVASNQEDEAREKLSLAQRMAEGRYKELSAEALRLLDSNTQ